jgi:PBP1b-binding outer membrane lipoprotein LpoB
MLRKVLVIMLAAAIGVFSLSGCKKKSDEEATAADYAAEAKKEINQQNKDAELEKIEKAMEEDIAAEP